MRDSSDREGPWGAICQSTLADGGTVPPSSRSGWGRVSEEPLLDLTRFRGGYALEIVIFLTSAGAGLALGASASSASPREGRQAARRPPPTCRRSNSAGPRPSDLCRPPPRPACAPHVLVHPDFPGRTRNPRHQPRSAVMTIPTTPATRRPPSLDPLKLLIAPRQRG